MTVLDQAENIQGVVSAARKRERWQQQAAKTSDPEKIAALEEAASTLEARFPELEDVPPGGAEHFARERGYGSGSRSPSREGKASPQSRQRAGNGGSSGGGSSGGGSSGGGSSGGGSSGGGGRRRGSATHGRGRGRRRRRERILSDRYSTRRLFWDTGIPGAASSITGTTMMVLGATVGLALLFLLLSSAERPGSGARAFPLLLRGVTDFISRFISVQDIFGGPGLASASAGADIPGLSDYELRILRGEVAGPLDPSHLRELLPQLPKLPHRPGQRNAFGKHQPRLPRHIREQIQGR
jgi:hypothetical protein